MLIAAVWQLAIQPIRISFADYCKIIDAKHYYVKDNKGFQTLSFEIAKSFHICIAAGRYEHYTLCVFLFFHLFISN